jgi:hypothetical protein
MIAKKALYHLSHTYYMLLRKLASARREEGYIQGHRNSSLYSGKEK